MGAGLDDLVEIIEVRRSVNSEFRFDFEHVLRIELKSLIMAQIERWRQA